MATSRVLPKGLYQEPFPCGFHGQGQALDAAMRIGFPIDETRAVHSDGTRYPWKGWSARVDAGGKARHLLKGSVLAELKRGWQYTTLRKLDS